MYKRLKEWVNVPFSYKPFIKYSGTGGEIFGDPIDGLCYPEGSVTIVRNRKGVNIASNTKLYMDGDVQISDLDCVIFDGKEHRVQAITDYYRGGAKDIRVVYI